MSAVAEGLGGGLFAGAEPLFTRLSCLEWNWAELAFDFMAAVAKRLIFGLAARTPKITFACLNHYRHWRFASYMTLHRDSF